jgi:signal transduction histidine kinase
MHQASRHRPSVEAQHCAGFPVYGSILLREALAGVPYCLLASDGEDSLTPLCDVELPLDARDPWSAELLSSRPWREVEGDDPVPLRPGGAGALLPDPDPWLRLRPLRDGERLRGGLLLRPSGGHLSREALEQLRSPVVERGLVHVIELWGTRREMANLRTFREAVSGTLPYGILALDGLGRVTYAGGRAGEILGFSEDVIGVDCARVFRPAGLDSNPLLDGLRRPLPPMELYVVRPDGTEVPILLQVARIHAGGLARPRQRRVSERERRALLGRPERKPARAADPRGEGVIAFFQDMTEERSLEEAQRHRDRLAVLGELSAGVAHEIRNPLTGIANCAQVLQEGMEAEDGRQRFLKIILEEAARLNRIVEGLLRYARPNRPELREAAVDESVRRVLELTRTEMEKKGIRVMQRVRGRIPKLYIDPAQIEQVLLNLARNAEEAMPSGGEITFELSVVRRRPHRRRGAGRRSTDRLRLHAAEGPLQRFVQIKICDTGHGIPRDLLPRVFNPFFTTRTRGTGLGLSLCQSIVREHGGFLTIRSVEKKGTTVLLDLPVERRQGERRKDG